MGTEPIEEEQDTANVANEEDDEFGSQDGSHLSHRSHDRAAGAGAADSDALRTELRRLRLDIGEQMRRLRVEHEALCSCLGAAGVVSLDSLDQELGKLGVRRNQRTEVAKGQLAVAAPPVTAGSYAKSRGSLRPSASAQVLQPAAAVGAPAAAGAGGSAMAPKRAARPASVPAAKRLDSAQGRASEEQRREARRLGSDAASKERGSRSQTSGAKQQAKVAAPEDALDLYDLAYPLLLPGARTAAKAKALVDVRAALARGRRPDVWRGPETPLLGALAAGADQLVQLLLRGRANLNVPNEKGAGPLHHTVFHGELDSTALLLEWRADPDLGDQHNQTPIFFAPTAHICETLVRKGANTNVINLKGQSALHLAAMANLGPVLVWLSQNVSRQLLDMRDNEGFTAEDYARKEGMGADIFKKIRPWDPTRQNKEEATSRTNRGSSYKQKAKPKKAERSSRRGSQGSGASSVPVSVLSPTPRGDSDGDGADGVPEGGHARGTEQENAAATKIQALQRGKQDRRRAAQKRAERDVRLDDELDDEAAEEGSEGSEGRPRTRTSLNNHTGATVAFGGELTAEDEDENPSSNGAEKKSDDEPVAAPTSIDASNAEPSTEGKQKARFGGFFRKSKGK